MSQRERGRVTGLTGTGRRIPGIGGPHKYEKKEKEKKSKQERQENGVEELKAA